MSIFLALVGCAAGFQVGPASIAAGRSVSHVQMTQPIGYQTESAGAQAMVREMQLADDVMMLRVAATRAAEDKDLESQRTLLFKCEKVKASLTKQLDSLKEQQKELLEL